MSEFDEKLKLAGLVAVDQLTNEMQKGTSSKDRISAASKILEILKDDPKTPSVQINFDMGKVGNVVEGIKEIAKNTKVLKEELEKED